MKKIFVLCLLIFLVGCVSDNGESIEIIMPEGVTSFTHIDIAYQQKGDNARYHIERITGPQVLVAAFTSESHDIIVAPVTLGANLISKGADYQLVAVVTWGNLYLVSGSPLKTIEDLSGRTVTAFGANTNPDLVLTSILEASDLSETVSVDFVDSAQASMMELIRESNSTVLLAEPFLTLVSDKLDDLYVLDLTDYWVSQLELDAFPQAGIFVKTNLSDNTLSQYLDDLSFSIEDALDNPVTTASKAEILDYPFDASIMASSIPRSGMAYYPVSEIMAPLEAYFMMVLAFNSALINHELPPDNFYRGSP